MQQAIPFWWPRKDKNIKTINSKDNRCVILARVSSKSQEDEGYSLDAQEKLLLDHAKEVRSLHIVETFRITETASKKDQRETFQAMLQYIRDNRIQYLVVEKVDRLTRNFKDAQAIDEWLEADASRHVLFLKNNLDLHKHAKSHEKFMWSIYVAVAKQYSDNLREEAAKGQLEKATQGWSPSSRQKLGYINIKRDEKIIQVQDTLKAPLIAKMFELYDTGNYSVQRLTDEINNEGLRTANGKKLVKTATYKILIDAYYYGILSWLKVEYTGKHKPIISKELFDRVQIRFKRPQQFKYNKYNLLFKGMFRCEECDKTIYWYHQKNHIYGECKNRACNVRITAREDLIETELLQYFDVLQAPSPAIVAWIKAELKKDLEAERIVRETSAKSWQKNLDRLERKMEAMYEDKLDGLITAERYKEKLVKLEQEYEDMSNQLAKHLKNHREYLDERVTIWEQSQTAAERYQQIKDADQRRIIIREIFSNLRLHGNSLLVEYREEVKLIAEAAEKQRQLEQTFEPSKKTSQQMREAFDEQSRSLWLSIQVWYDLQSKMRQMGHRTAIFGSVSFQRITSRPSRVLRVLSPFFVGAGLLVCLGFNFPLLITNSFNASSPS